MIQIVFLLIYATAIEIQKEGQWINEKLFSDKVLL